MTASGFSGSKSRRSRGQFAEILKVQGKLALREPYGILGGIAFPVILLVVFWFISSHVPGNVGNTGLTVLDLWIPTLMVIAFVTITISLPSTLVRDREIGWLRRVSTTPVHPWRLLAAQLVVNLLLAVVAIVVLFVGAGVFFGASLRLSVPFFVLATVLSMAEIFAFGLMVVAIVPSQTIAQPVAGVLFFLLLFLSGLWVNPAQVGEPLRSVMYYSPTGAAAKALLAAVFSSSPPYAAWVTMAAYAAIFGFIAIRFFRWE